MVAVPVNPLPLVQLLDKVPRLHQINSSSSHLLGCLEQSRRQHLGSRLHLVRLKQVALELSGNPAEVLETRLNSQPLEEDRPTLQLQLLEDNLQLHSKQGVFSHLVAEVGPPTPRAQQPLTTLGSTLELLLPALHLSTSEEAEVEVEQRPAARPTCLVSQVEPTTNPQPSAAGRHLSSGRVQELRLQVVEVAEAQCSVSGLEVISPEQPPHRGELPRPEGPGSDVDIILSQCSNITCMQYPVM